MKGNTDDRKAFSTSQPARAAYDRLAAIYDRRWKKYVRSTLAPLVNTLDFEGGESVLDVACGTGELERLLVRRWPGLKLTGCDLSHAMLRKAGEKKLSP